MAVTGSLSIFSEELFGSLQIIYKEVSDAAAYVSLNGSINDQSYAISGSLSSASISGDISSAASLSGRITAKHEY